MTTRFTGVAAVFGLFLTLALTACGGSSGTASSATTATQAANANAARSAAINCLRQHGVTFQPGAPPNASPQTLQAARQACQQYLRAFPRQQLTPAQRARNRAASAAVRSCLASHGYKLPAPPTPPAGAPGRGRGGGLGLGGLQAALSTPAGRKAVTACAPVIAKLRAGGGGRGGFFGPGAPGRPGAAGGPVPAPTAQ